MAGLSWLVDQLLVMVGEYILVNDTWWHVTPRQNIYINKSLDNAEVRQIIRQW